jgi:hypothetical protein
MSQRAERVWELFLPKEEETAPTQLHLFHSYRNRSKQVIQVIDFPQDDLVQAIETGRHECECFYHRINRPGARPLKQLKQQKGAPFLSETAQTRILGAAKDGLVESN